MKTSYAFAKVVLLAVLASSLTAAQAVFTGKVCYVTPMASGTTFPHPVSGLTNKVDTVVINKLISWGFTVDIAMPNNTSNAQSFNNTSAPIPSDATLASYALVVFSEWTSSGNGNRIRGLNTSALSTLNIPIVSLDNWFVRTSAAGFQNSNTAGSSTFFNAGDSTYASGIKAANSVTIVDGTGHPLSKGFAQNQQVQLVSGTADAAKMWMNFAVLPATVGQSIIPIAGLSDSTGKLVAWGAEAGTGLFDASAVFQSAVTLKKRYAAVGIMGGAYSYITNDGWNLIKNAVTWVAPAAVVSGMQEPSTGLPAGCRLEQNFPNPFNPSTAISYEVAAASHVRLTVHDVIGRCVATLVDGIEAAGRHQVSMDASHLPSGTYFYTLNADGMVFTKAMVLAR